MIVKGMHKVFPTAIALLLFAVAHAAYGQRSDDANLRRLAEAAGAIQENRLPRAEELLNAILATSPADADALNLLGVVRAKQTRPNECSTAPTSYANASVIRSE